ncbi:MAG: methyltransferase [Microthrixaceae bacterium]
MDQTAESPEALLERLMMDWQYAQMVRTFVTLGLPEAIGADERELSWLAAKTSTHEPSLRRLLGVCSALGLVERSGSPGTYELGPAGRLLTPDADGPLRDLLLLCTAPWLMRPWDHLDETIRTGQAAFSAAHGTDYWSYVATHPEEAAAFNEGMAAGSVARAHLLASQIDLDSGMTVVDVGGGTGLLLGTLLSVKPGVLGILADTPEVVAAANPVLTALGVQHRVTVIGSDFLQEVPAGGDVYVLSRIVHDWPDGPAELILRNTRAAMQLGARVVLIEGVLPEQENMAAEDMLDLAREDLEMLVLVGGQERTRLEYAALLGRAGLELIAVHEHPGRDLVVAVAV